MAIVLDADVIIGGEKGVFDLQTWLVSRSDDQFEIAAINCGRALAWRRTSLRNTEG